MRAPYVSPMTLVWVTMRQEIAKNTRVSNREQTMLGTLPNSRIAATAHFPVLGKRTMHIIAQSNVKRDAVSHLPLSIEKRSRIDKHSTATHSIPNKNLTRLESQNTARTRKRNKKEVAGMATSQSVVLAYTSA